MNENNERLQSSVEVMMCEELDEDMSDDDLFKMTQKRKNSGSGHSEAKVCKASRGAKSSQGSALSSQEEVQGLYPPSDIKTFLETTKGQRLPSVEDHFSDLNLFLKSSKPLTKKTGSEEFLTHQEIYRLRKLVLRVKSQMITDEDEF